MPRSARQSVLRNAYIKHATRLTHYSVGSKQCCKRTGVCSFVELHCNIHLVMKGVFETLGSNLNVLASPVGCADIPPGVMRQVVLPIQRPLSNNSNRLSSFPQWSCPSVLFLFARLTIGRRGCLYRESMGCAAKHLHKSMYLGPGCGARWNPASQHCLSWCFWNPRLMLLATVAKR